MRFLCSALLFQSVVPSSVPQTICHQKNSPSKRRSYFLVVCIQSLHTRSSCFRQGLQFNIQLHFVTVIRSLNASFHCADSSLIHFTTFQQYYCLSPFALIRGCSYDQQLGFAPLAFCTKSRNASLILILSPKFHSLSISLHFVNYAQFPS